MSDSDEMELDEDEIASMREGVDISDIDPEDLFHLTQINKNTNKKISIEVQTKEGETVLLRDIVQELLDYISNKLTDKNGNQFADQIFPLITQAIVPGLLKIVGTKMTACILSHNLMRDSIVHMMCVAFLLPKFIQQKGLSLQTFEENVSEEEITNMERRSNAGSTAMLAALAGIDPRAVLQQMRDQGLINETDLEDMLGKRKNNDKGKL